MPFGLPITPDQAKPLLARKKDIIDNNVPFLTALFDRIPDQFSKRFFCNPKSAFIFDASLIRTILDHAAPNDASHLVIIVAAQDMDGVDGSGDNFFVADPTVIAVACQRTGTNFTSIGVSEPAVEHPPKRVKINFADMKNVGSDNVIFTIS